MPKGKLVTRKLDANLTAVGTSAALACNDLENISFYVEQAVDNGTLVAQLEVKVGDLWLPVGAAVTEITLGTSVAQEVEFSDSNGMSKRAEAVRLDVTTHTGTGEYNLHVVGSQREGY